MSFLKAVGLYLKTTRGMTYGSYQYLFKKTDEADTSTTQLKLWLKDIKHTDRKKTTDSIKSTKTYGDFSGNDDEVQDDNTPTVE